MVLKKASINTIKKTEGTHRIGFREGTDWVKGTLGRKRIIEKYATIINTIIILASCVPMSRTRR
jgi:hypothetical protein